MKAGAALDLEAAGLDRVSLHRLLREGCAELERLGRIRGAYRWTARRITRARLQVVLAASLLGMPLASPASAAEPRFMPPLALAFRLPGVGGQSSPTLADLDGDGDLDAFVGEFSGDTIFFENTGTASAPAFAPPVTNPFGLADVGFLSAPSFADLDGDGDLDAFIGEYDGDTFFFENTGTAGNPALASPVTNPFGLADVGLYSAPSFADLDGDGDLDAFVGERSASTFFFENTGTAGAPAFASPVANPFGLADVVFISAPSFADLDGDGDLDAFIGRGDGDTLFFENTGTAGAPAFASPVTNPFGLSDVGSRSRPSFADLDGDGDLDTFIGAYSGDAFFFENMGTADAPAFAQPEENPFGLADVGLNGTPTFGDLDGDGDLDAFIGERYGDTLFFENLGTASAPAFAVPEAHPFGLADLGDRSAPTFADLDGDGDLDAFNGENFGRTFFFENLGTPSAPAFVAPVTNPFGLAGVGYRSVPTFADLDGDGDLDAFVGEYYGATVFFENTGTASAPAFAAPVTNPFGLASVDYYGAPTFADLDGDGDLDAFIGEDLGNTVFFENVTSSPLDAEVTPKLKLNFRKELKDSIQLKLKQWVLPGDFVAAGAELSVNVGGSVVAGTLDAKGKFKSADKRDKLKLKQRKKDGTWTLSVKRKKGDFAAALLDEGLRDEDNAKPGKVVRVTVSIDAGGSTYARFVELSYRSKLGKTGSAK